MRKLFDNRTTDGTSETARLSTPVTVIVDGGFGGGSLAIQTSGDVDGVSSAVWSTVRTVTSTDSQRFNVFQLGVYHLRAVLSGATAATLTVSVS